MGDPLLRIASCIDFPALAAEVDRAFTAIGIVEHGEPYQVEMGGGFQPFRRDVCWIPAEVAPIRPILGRLEFSAGKQNWGYQFRFGLFSISDHDMNVIAAAMEADFAL